MITYNHVRYIRRAIESVLNQRTDFPFELVIGEDCSTDGTREIVEEYAARHPHVIRLLPGEHNLGMRLNSNRTTDACRGRYIAWCEGDDYWHRQDKLAIQVEYLETHPDCGLIHSDHDRAFEERNCIIRSFFKTTGNEPSASFDLIQGWNDFHVLTCTAMARAEFVHEISADENIYRDPSFKGAGDVPLFIELGMRSRIHYLPESLATYNVHADSATRLADPSRAAEFVLANNQAKLYLAKKYGLREEMEIYRKRVQRSELWMALFSVSVDLSKSTWQHILRPAPMDHLLHFASRFRGVRRIAIPLLKKYLKARAEPPQSWFRHAEPMDSGN